MLIYSMVYKSGLVNSNKYLAIPSVVSMFADCLYWWEYVDCIYSCRLTPHFLYCAEKNLGLTIPGYSSEERKHQENDVRVNFTFKVSFAIAIVRFLPHHIGII